MLIAKVHNAKYIIEKPKMTILIQSDSKIVLPEIKKKSWLYINIKVNSSRNVSILYRHALNNKASHHMKEKLISSSREIDKFTIIIAYFINPLLLTDKKSRNKEKINNDIGKLNNP